jgi:uncharacterized membrane protein
MVEYTREYRYFMDKKQKRTLIIIGAIEAVILIFCLVISIMVLTTWISNASAQTRIDKNGAFIGGLQNNPTIFMVAICLPVFIIFIVDAVYLIVYAYKKPSALSDSERAEIEKRAKEEAKAEIEAEMAAEAAKKAEK